jgi:CheY-like chemotaxis protein
MLSLAYMARSRRRQKPKQFLILMVEDDADLLALAKSIVEGAGYATLSAANAREALALLEDGAAIDLLFTDINIPDGSGAFDGVELARRAVELRPGLPVIYTTGGDVTDGLTALFVERSALLRKPYRNEELTEAIRRALPSARARP